jgi:hypothetical protein
MGSDGRGGAIDGPPVASVANRMTLNQFDALQRSTALRSALGRQALVAYRPAPTKGPYGPASVRCSRWRTNS